MKHSNELQAGLFITLGIALFIIVIFLLGQRRQIFVQQENYTATFTDVQGLSEGAPVRLGGITIGRVDTIGFSTDNKDPNVYVDILISSKYLERIRTDSIATIETQGLLGDKLVNIKSDGSGNMLEPGSELRSSEPADIASVLNKAGEVVDNTVEISRSVSGLVGELRDSTSESLTTSIAALSEILTEVKDGSGFLHTLIYADKEGASILKNLDATSHDLKAISKEIRNGKGLLNALIYAPEGKTTLAALADASKNIAVTAGHISKLAQEIESGDGLLHSVVYDEAPGGIAEIVNKLNRTATNLEKASAALANGEGTLGALLVDAQLYDNAVEITDGAKRSFLLKEAIKSTLR